LVVRTVFPVSACRCLCSYVLCEAPWTHYGCN